MTLIELLVVMVIITTLVAAAIPLLSPPGDERVIREASRGVNTFLAGAQSRAVETGRPFGVALKKLSQDTLRLEDSAVCLEMYYVQQPAPYSGFDDAARVRIALDGTNGGGFVLGQPYQVRIQFVRLETNNTVNPAQGALNALPAGVSREIMPDSFFAPGDVIVVDGSEFVFIDDNGYETGLDSRGRYPADAGAPDGTLLATGPSNIHSTFSFVYDNWGNRVTGTPNPMNSPYWTEPLRFKLLRQPSPTSNQPYQLPTGAAIDLRASGFTIRSTNPANTTGEFAKPRLDVGAAAGVNNPIENNNPVYIMFSPEGSIDRVTYDRGASAWNADGTPATSYSATPFSEPVTDNVQLLVGVRENIPAPWIDFTAFTGTEQDLATEKAKINWLNLNSQWVAIGAQTGAVTTVPNAAVNPTLVDSSLSPLRRRAFEINSARALVRESAKAGGR